MRLFVLALGLVAFVQPAVAAGGGAQGEKAAPQQGTQSYSVTAPAQRNPLPRAILEKMREGLLALRGETVEAPAEPAPSGH